jgi:hypothetical protein
VEASVAGQQGYGEAVDGPPDQQQTDGGGAPQGGDQHADVNSLVETLGQNTQSLGEMRAYLESRPWEQGAVGAPDPAEYEGQWQQPEYQPEAQQQPQADLSFLNPESGTFDPQRAAQALNQLWDQEAQRRSDALVQQHVQPLYEQQRETVRGLEANELAAEFPQLADPATAESVVDYSRQVANAMGNPELAMEPKFWRLIFMAARGAEAANAEQDEVAPQVATLEGSAGASPGGVPQGVSAEQLLGIGQRRGRNALPFG